MAASPISTFLSTLTSETPTREETAALYAAFSSLIDLHGYHLSRGRLLASPELSTGSANTATTFTGENLIPFGWRQARATLDLTGDNNGVVVKMIPPGVAGEDRPRARTVEYYAAHTMTFTPLVQAVVQVYLVSGAAPDIDINGTTVVLTYLAATTTVTDLIALLAGTFTGETDAQLEAARQARALLTMTGTAGTIPATFEGGLISLTDAPLIEVVQAAVTAVDWNATTRVVTIGLDIGTAGDSLANVKAALAASASGAMLVVQLADVYGSSGAGDITTSGVVSLTGGRANESVRRGVLVMAQGTNKDLAFDALDTGPDATPISIELVNLTTADPPTVDVFENDESVAIRVYAKVGTSTAAQILAVLRESEAAMDWITVRLADGSSGAGAPAAFGPTMLAWSADALALDVRVGSLPGAVTALCEDSLTVDIAALGATHPADSTVNVFVRVGNAVYQTTGFVVA